MIKNTTMPVSWFRITCAVLIETSARNLFLNIINGVQWAKLLTDTLLCYLQVASPKGIGDWESGTCKSLSIPNFFHQSFMEKNPPKQLACFLNYVNSI